MLFRPNAALAAACFASLTLLAACGDDDNGPNRDDTELTQAEADAISNELREEIAGLSATTSLSSLFNPGNPPAVAGAVRAPCPALSEDPVTDADEDGIPDDLTATFNPADCIFTSWGGQAVLTLDGAVRVEDLSASDPALRISFDDFEGLFTYNNRAFRREADGKVQLETSVTGFSGYDSTSVEQEATGRPDATLKKGWSIAFTSAAEDDFTVNQPLPDGVFDLNGSLRRTWGDKVREFNVTTVEPLEYDASCVSDDRIVAGELDAEFDSDEHHATVNIVWNGCGVEPTVTIVSGPVT